MDTKRKYISILIWITIFSIAMGYLESSVVIYLRALLYPEGFAFPLVQIEPQLGITELLRETATIIMLLTAGIIAGKNSSERFAWFMYAFAIWDIFYYVFLKLLINWPESLMTWDILFLIPVTWVGPVISPVIVALTMIGFALLIIKFNMKNIRVRISLIQWLILGFGSLILILAWTWDYSGYILQHYSFKEIWTMPSKEPLYDLALSYIPISFNWFLFWLGEIVIILGIVHFYIKNKKRKTAT